MDTATVIGHARRLIEKLRLVEAAHEGPYRPGLPAVEGLQAQTADFLRSFAGPRSPFVKTVEDQGGAAGDRANVIVSVLEAFIDHLEAGLLQGIAPERKGQLDVVSDLLGQANTLLDDRAIHPVAPAVIVGASLEEFLRTWVEAAGLSMGNRKPSLANYAHVLREADLIGKQDGKDIESWGGLRNHAAHGEWDQVADPQRIRLMLEGVNLFIRRHTP